MRKTLPLLGVVSSPTEPSKKLCQILPNRQTKSSSTKLTGSDLIDLKITFKDAPLFVCIDSDPGVFNLNDGHFFLLAPTQRNGPTCEHVLDRVVQEVIQNQS